jgi:hypothetical protein
MARRELDGNESSVFTNKPTNKLDVDNSGSRGKGALWDLGLKMSLPGKMGDGGLVAEPNAIRWGNLFVSFPDKVGIV